MFVDKSFPGGRGPLEWLASQCYWKPMELATLAEAQGPIGWGAAAQALCSAPIQPLQHLYSGLPVGFSLQGNKTRRILLDH